MSEALKATNGSASFWRWIAVLAVTILLAGAPGYIQLLLNEPSRGEVDALAEHQRDVLERLAVVETKLALLEAERE